MSSDFLKMTAAGNDFLVLDDRDASHRDTSPGRWELLCSRRTGVGADGVLLIRTPGHAEALYTMHYLNADGSEAAMCGNGARCIAWAAAVEKGLGVGLTVDTPRPGNWELPEGIGARQVWSISFEAPDGLHHALGWERNVMVSLGDPTDPQHFSAPGRGEEGEWEGALLTVGVPHLVLPVEDPARIDVGRSAPPLRHHEKLGPDGANVDFVAQEADEEGVHAIRTYERGVEGETLACGTGAASAAAYLASLGASSPVSLRPPGGEVLRIHFTRDPDEPGRIRDLWLEGPVLLVYRGTLADI